MKINNSTKAVTLRLPMRYELQVLVNKSDKPKPIPLIVDESCKILMYLTAAPMWTNTVLFFDP